MTDYQVIQKAGFLQHRCNVLIIRCSSFLISGVLCIVLKKVYTFCFALVGVFHQQDPRARGLDGTAGHTTNRDDEVLPKPYIDCMAVRHFGLLVKNTNKGGKNYFFKTPM